MRSSRQAPGPGPGIQSTRHDKKKNQSMCKNLDRTPVHDYCPIKDLGFCTKNRRIAINWVTPGGTPLVPDLYCINSAFCYFHLVVSVSDIPHPKGFASCGWVDFSPDSLLLPAYYLVKKLASFHTTQQGWFCHPPC